MLAKQPSDRPNGEDVYNALAPLASAGARSAADRDARDPRRPFLRPLAPAPRQRPTPAVGREPLAIDEAIDLRSRVRRLVEADHLQQAIDLLEDAVRRAGHSPELQLEVSFDLATTLYAADEFSRAAPVLDRILPQLAQRDGETDPTVLYLRYIAGVSHAEAGDPSAAIAHLTAFIDRTTPSDPLYRDAVYQRALMLYAVGQTAEGIAELRRVRPLFAAEFGEDSIHVRALDRRIEQLGWHTKD
jgi:tetratricopeptide (TPR) repeat protein